MKSFIAFILAVFFASSALAQDQTQQQTPPSVQTDTTSGWQLVFSNPKLSFGYLQFLGNGIESGVVYAGASNGTNNVLFRSTNMGLTWDSLSTPVPGGPIDFATPLIGYAGSSPGVNVVWKTIDGAQSWTSYPRNSVAEGPIAFANNDTGLIFGPCCMARTTDAGNTWMEIIPPTDVVKYGASFADSKVGYAVGSLSDDLPSHPNSPPAGYCQKTTDGGATWTQVYTGMPHYLRCCKALTPNTLVVGGTERAIGRTSDGGITWDTISIGDQYSLYQSVSFSDTLDGMIVGYATTTSGIILATSDGGKSWQRQYAPNIPPLLGVLRLSDSVAIVCGRGNIYRTINGGNFSSVKNNSYDFQLQIFPNPATSIVTIQYQLPTTESVSLTIYNIQGNIIGSINPGIQNAGNQQATFDTSGLPNGAYYISITAGGNRQTGSFTIQK
jgi:photosystem II stability/assembly factor-like uncharacterized protein